MSPHPKLGLLTGPEPVDSPWLRAFELIERIPWREDRVQRWLTEHDAGTVEVKTRGKAVAPDVVQPRLTGTGTQAYVLFVLRWGKQIDALIARRLQA